MDRRGAAAVATGVALVASVLLLLALKPQLSGSGCNPSCVDQSTDREYAAQLFAAGGRPLANVPLSMSIDQFAGPRDAFPQTTDRRGAFCFRWADGATVILTVARLSSSAPADPRYRGARHPFYVSQYGIVASGYDRPNHLVQLQERRGDPAHTSCKRLEPDPSSDETVGRSNTGAVLLAYAIPILILLCGILAVAIGRIRPRWVATGLGGADPRTARRDALDPLAAAA
jgi:hypothetical protein